MQIKDPMNRGGNVSAGVKAVYLAQTGRQLTSKEARLLPYVRYRACNGGYLERRAVSDNELLIIDELCTAGLMVMNGDRKIGLTRKLFDLIGMIEWDVYCTQAVDDDVTTTA